MSHNLPAALLTALEQAPGFTRNSFEQVHSNPTNLVSIRLNPAKKPSCALFGNEEQVPWNNNGRYLKERPSFTLDPLLHAGAYYVQEASSMFVAEVMKQCSDLSQPLKVLDLCAAPGGKSTLLQSIISEESLLVSNEVIKTRVNILTENITKWGAANVVVSNNDPSHFARLENYFDVILVDAPCSGSGLFRRDPAAVDEWSEHSVELCSQRQQRILADIIPSLKPGGVLIYSTCSYSVEEDEDNCRWIIENFSMESISLKIQASWGIVETVTDNNFSYRFYPDKVKGEGLFIACFRKKDNENGSEVIFKKVRPAKLTVPALSVLTPYVKDVNTLAFIQLKDEIIALPLHLEVELPILQNALYIKKAGVRIGKLIRDELLPDHELALSTIINENIPSVNVDKTTALQYLRREDFDPRIAVKGWTLVKYGGLALGWIKILPNRVNNYYPKEWRILMRG